MSKLKSVYVDRTGDWVRSEIDTGNFYLKEEADKVIAELKDKCQMHDFFWEGCDFAKRRFKNAIAVSEAFDDLEAENRRLKRTLWISRTEMARTSAWVFWNRNDDYNYNKWKKIECKCRAKAEEYK